MIPSGYVYIAIEHCHLLLHSRIKKSSIVMLYSLPEGNRLNIHYFKTIHMFVIVKRPKFSTSCWNLVGTSLVFGRSEVSQAVIKQRQTFSGSAWSHGFTQYKTKPKLVWKSKFTRLASTHRFSVSCKQFLDVWIGHSQFISPFLLVFFSNSFLLPRKKNICPLDWPGLTAQVPNNRRVEMRFPEFRRKAWLGGAVEVDPRGDLFDNDPCESWKVWCFHYVFCGQLRHETSKIAMARWKQHVAKSLGHPGDPRGARGDLLGGFNCCYVF